MTDAESALTILLAYIIVGVIFAIAVALIDGELDSLSGLLCVLFWPVAAFIVVLRMIGKE